MTLPARIREAFRHPWVRYARFAPTFFIAIIAAAIVASVTVDLGPGLRALAEREGSKRFERPIHIGRLSIHLLSGRVVLDDLLIDGRRPGDRPFFTGKQLRVSLDWSAVLQRRPEFIITAVEMTDWRMLVEKWKDGHNFIRVGSNGPPREGPPRFVTTLKYLHAYRGQFTYEDHELPWSVDCPNLDITIGNLPKYHGQAAFNGGLVKIQDYVPMWADMRASFMIDEGKIKLDRIDLTTDGARSELSGVVDPSRFPEMTYDVKSRVDFSRQREIFFARETWNLTGEGDFTGVFHLFKGGHDLTGRFTSAELGVNDYRFPSLYGDLHWTPKAFDVTNGGAKAFGGDARLSYSIKPLGSPERPHGRFEVSYANVDVARLTDFYQLRGVRFAGSASGHNLLDWPMGRFVDRHDEGAITVTPPPGVPMMTASLAAARAEDPNHSRHEWGPFAPMPLPAHVPMAGRLAYRMEPGVITLEDGIFATDRTHVSFAGTTDWGSQSNIAFHVTSRDWQESDQLLAGIITDFGSPTGVVAFGGRGEFDGVMTGAFRSPRVEGEFTGEDMRAWDTIWGDGGAHIVVENGYVTVRDSVVRMGGSEIRADGRFSLGYPRRDRGEEIDARFRVARRDMESLRHAFQLDDWPVTGAMSGEFHLTGAYEHPLGFGAMTIDDGAAFSQPFDRATAALRFDGKGVRLDGIEIAEGSGAVTGAAYIAWDATYSFNADGRRIPVDRIALLQYPGAPATGAADFTAGGSSSFDEPRYDVRFRVDDLAVGGEPVGQVTGSLALRGDELSGDIDAASPRLAVTGTGRIALTAEADSDITIRFHDSSFDPYVRLFVPKLSPYTTTVASGTIRIVGELADIDRMSVDATVDALDMRLFDYAIRNASPIRLSLASQEVRVRQLQLVGEDTRLEVSGSVGLRDETMGLHVEGDAGLGILQGFFRDVRGSGRAELSAAIDGPIAQPVFSGSATITGGRVRHLALPNALDAINGVVHFDSRGVRLDDLTATLGGGRLQFGGRVGFDGYTPGDLNVTVRGENVRLRYPEGVRSVIDGDLALNGTFREPTLGGSVTVRSAVWTKRLDPTGGLFDFGAGGSGVPSAPVADAIPLRLDIRVLIPSSLRVDNNVIENMVASADLQLRGTYERPVVVGRAEVDRGVVRFEGRRYTITRGTIDFTNPNRVEPFFDVEAETMVRVPGQTYRVIVSAAGTSERLQPQLTSDPPLPAGDVLTLLFSDVRRGQGPASDVELRARQNPNERQTDILTTRATQVLAAPLSNEVGRVVERTFGVDTFTVSPSLVDPYATTSTLRVNPSARVTIGKRISDRVFLTFSRSISTTTNDQIILLEYTESDLLSWILSRNEDQTYAIEFRVRHTF